MRRITITSQIAEIEREITVRGRTYPGLIHKGKMRSAEAEECMERLRAVRDTLLFCQRHEQDIRAFIAGKQQIEAQP